MLDYRYHKDLYVKLEVGSLSARAFLVARYIPSPSVDVTHNSSRLTKISTPK